MKPKFSLSFLVCRCYTTCCLSSSSPELYLWVLVGLFAVWHSHYSCWVTGWATEESGFYSWHGHPHLLLNFSPPPFQWVRGFFSPGINLPGHEADHLLRLVPRIMHGGILRSPIRFTTWRIVVHINSSPITNVFCLHASALLLSARTLPHVFSKNTNVAVYTILPTTLPRGMHTARSRLPALLPCPCLLA
jgi:hypothetical protein